MSAQWELDLERATQAACDDAYDDAYAKALCRCGHIRAGHYAGDGHCGGVHRDTGALCFCLSFQHSNVALQERDEALLAQVREIALDADRQRFEALKAADPCCIHLSPVLYPSGHFCACSCHLKEDS